MRPGHRLKLHIHSDCPYWGGSENMVRVFLMNGRLNDEFDISFSYRHSAAYERGMREWVDMDRVKAHVRGLRLPVSWVYRAAARWRPLTALRYLAMLYEAALFADAFRRDPPDVLHVNNGGYPGATSCNGAVIGARLAGVKRVTYMVNSTARDLWWERPMTRLVRGGKTQFITASDHLFQVSSFLYNKMGWKVIPNTVLYQHQPASAYEATRRTLGIPTGAFLFVVAGADEPRKGRDVFVEALFQVAKETQTRDSFLWLWKEKRSPIIVGPEGSIAGWLSDPEDNRGLGDYNLISAADCVVVPSLRDEDFPNVILIAMMYGKPVIASDVGGMGEAVDDGQTGYVVAPGDVDDLVWSMKRMALDRNRATRMGQSGRGKFEVLYSEDKVIDQYISLWRGE